MPPEPQNIGAEDDLEFEQNVSTLLASLPAPVRSYVTGKGPDAVVLELTRKYQLHADQAGELHKALLMMLLGVYSPSRFVGTLEDAGFSEETTEGIVADLNERVFAPLRKAEREAEKKPPTPAKAAVPPAPRPPLASVPAPLGAATMPAPEPPRPAPIAAVPPAAAPSPAPAIQPATTPTPAPRPSAPPPEPVMRTMAHDVESMNGQGASQAPAYPPPVPVPAPTPTDAPAPAPERAAVPSAWSAPVSAPRSETPPPHPTRAIGAPDPQEVASTLKKYGVDPYREPPE